KKPKELCHFSLNVDRKYTPDRSELRHFYYVQASHSGFDLSSGFEDYVPFEEPEERLDFLLQAVIDYEKTKGRIATDFFSYRGLLTKILMAPHEQSAFKFNVMHFDGQVFMKQDLAFKESESVPFASKPMQAQKADYAGRKFEHVATIPKPWPDCSRQEVESRYSDPIQAQCQYISVVRTGIGSLAIAIAGEVDAVYDWLPADEDPLKHYLELKMTVDPQSSQKTRAKFLQEKLPRAWAQSFLIGIPRIVYGFRDYNYNLIRTEEYSTMKIPSVIRAGSASLPHFVAPQNPWNANKAIEFLAGFLEWLIPAVLAYPENTVLDVAYTPASSP
ncbi:hypothetical protein CANCADRAFT_13484, partial [Tortispora caseinolytica NRRL Y-17796]